MPGWGAEPIGLCQRGLVTTFLASIRDGRFLTRQRLTVYSAFLLAGFAVAILWIITTAHGLSDYAGRPLGTDFSSFHTAGRLALEGRNPFDQAALYRAEQSAFGNATRYYSFAYPPIFLLPAAALAMLPYATALALWLALTFGFYLAAMAALRARFDIASDAERRLFLLVAVAFPGVFVNLSHGQNGFLAAGLMTIGLALLDGRPLAAGLCFGLLAFKPQLGILIPFALAAGGRWKTFAAAAATVAVLMLASVMAFGIESWRGFLGAMAFSRQAVLDHDGVGYAKMISVFAAARLWHAPLALSYGLQALVGAAVILLTVRLWRSAADLRLKGAALCLGTLLVTPFALDYDLMLLAPAMALVAGYGRKQGFAPFTLSLLTLLWAMPLLSRPVAMITLILLAPLAILALLLMIRQRSKA
jgi:alpha-1,2-mannosyltransferase